MFAATALTASCRPALAPRRASGARPARRAQVAPRALAPVEVLQLAADAAPGTVDAPIWAIVGGERGGLAGSCLQACERIPCARAAHQQVASGTRSANALLSPSPVAGAVVVTAASFLVSLGLKPGAEGLFGQARGSGGLPGGQAGRGSPTRSACLHSALCLRPDACRHRRLD